MKGNVLLAALAANLFVAFPALAAAGRQDHSGLVVWIFLGFCGLIVVAQLVPVVLMALGLVKGTLQRHEPVAQKAAEQPIQK